MKILYVHQHFKTPDEAGGTRSYEMARRFIARGHTVAMVCGRTSFFRTPAGKASPSLAREKVAGIEVIRLNIPYSNCDGILKQSLSFIRFGLASAWRALRDDYDVLFTTSTPLTAAIPGIVAKTFRRRKVFVFEARDLWPEVPRALGMKNPLLLAGMSLLEWLGYRCADACVGLAPGICEGIARRSQPNKRVAMIPNCSDLNLFKPGQRQEWNTDGIAPSDTVALYAGSHDVANGLDAILDAAAELKRRKRTDIALVFIGDGQVKSALQRRIQQEQLTRCIMIPALPKEELSKRMASADIGMMTFANIPTFYNGTSPNKFFDYIAAGLPVLVNYPGWLADLVRKYRSGLTVDPEDPAAFADALIEMADNPQRREIMGQNARRLAEQEFSRDALGQRLAEFIEETARGFLEPSVPEP